MVVQWTVLEGGSYQLGSITVVRNPRDGFGLWRVKHQGREIMRYRDLKDAMDYGEQLAQRIK